MSAAVKPEFITFTGADDTTDIKEMIALSADYPIEWGILFSPKRQGIEPRYPTMRTIKSIASNLELLLAAHLCGGDAREVIEHGESRHDELLAHAFDRAQINTADPHLQPSMIAQWGRRRELRAILQCRGPFPKVDVVDVLFDASGGRGISPSDWPQGLDRLCGYAGGLSPSNVAAAVAIIGQRAQKYWIDMESGVRDEQDRFDLNKCRAVCEAVYGAAKATGAAS